MKGENEALSVCQIINFIEDDALFGCLEPIKYKVIIMETEAASCQRHYDLFRSEVERNGLSEMIKFVEINTDHAEEF